MVESIGSTLVVEDGSNIQTISFLVNTGGKMNKPLKWSTFIERAEKVGRFSRRAKERVQTWPDCAIGEHEALLTGEDETDNVGLRYYDNRHGSKLRSMGMEFMRLVKRDRVYSARRLYRAINRVVRGMGLA